MNNLFNNHNKNDLDNKEFSENHASNINNINSNDSNITILDFQKNIEKRFSITSPRSLLALKICGYKQEELYKLTFNEFVKTYPEIKNISKEFQEHRYFYFDKNREEKITKVINIRQQIIDEKFRENNKLLNNKENDCSITDNSKNLNKSNSFLSINFNKSLKHYTLLNNINNRNKNQISLNYNSFTSKSVINNQEKPPPLSDRSQKLIDYYKLKNENELLNVLSNEVNRKLIKKKLLNKEFFKMEFEKQKKQKIEEKKYEEQKKLELVRSAKYKIIKEKEEKLLKEYQEKEKKIKIRLEQEKQKSKEKEKEYQEKNLEKKIKYNLYKMQKEKEYDNIQLKNDQKIKKYEEDEKKRLINLIKHREIIEHDRKLQSQKTKELIQKRDDNIFSKSQDIMESYKNKEHITEKILQKFEKERMENYLLKKTENDNMKLERDKKKQNILKIKEAMILKNKLRMKQIEERQNEMEINYKKIKEEKRNNLKLEEIKRNQKLKSYEKERNVKKINILENIKNKENKYKELCRQRDDKIKKKIEEINIKKFFMEDKIKKLKNIYDFQRENLKKEIELKLKKAEDYKKEQHKINEDKKEIIRQIKNNNNIFKEREKEILHQKEINLQILEGTKDLLNGNPELEKLISKYKNSLEDKNENKSN